MTITYTHKDTDYAIDWIDDVERYRQVAEGAPTQASDGCEVEADGICEHGRPSPLLTLGLI